MAYSVTIERGALRDLKRLPEAMRVRVDEHIADLAANPRPPGVEKLSGSDCSCRLRVGDYRILYEIHDQVLHVLVVKAGHRRDVYRGV